MKDIPLTWIISLLLVGLIGLRYFGVDSWTTAALSTIIGYLTGKHTESVRASYPPCKEVTK